MRFGHQNAQETPMSSNPFHFATATAALALAALSPQAFACDPIAGALVGGGIGAAIGNGPGAAVGAVIGSTIAATTPCYSDPRAAYYEPRYVQRGYAPQPAYAAPAYAPPPAYADSGYATPAPSYYAPAPTYYAPAPTYYAPAPVYYQPAPYYYSPYVYAAAAAAPFFIYRGARFVSSGRHFRRFR
jgi:hypothetical protein